MGIITETHNDNVAYVENIVQEDAHEDLILSRTSYQVETEKTHQVATETENQLAADTEQQLSALIADSSEDSHTRLQANERKESKKGSRKGSRKGSGKGSRKGSRKGRKHGKVKEQTQREEVVVSELVHSEFVRKDDFTQQLKEEASEIITHHVTERTPTVEPDQDECNLNLDECSHVCVNTIGSYECQCYNGFLLAEDGFNCYDEDECLNSPCGQVCTNTPGSYVCSCREGYNLDHTAHLCYDTDGCDVDGSNNCTQLCANTPGSFVCDCVDGYELAEDACTCVDVDECLGDHMCDSLCVNTEGSYECACEPGYQLVADNGYGCEDVDECRYRNGDCPQVCVNTLGSHHCACEDGFTLMADGISCTDVDECSLGNYCSHICVNEEGGVRCECEEGYYLDDDERNCLDYDECEKSNPCHHNCRNLAGGYECECDDGYFTSDGGRTCQTSHTEVNILRTTTTTVTARWSSSLTDGLTGYHVTICKTRAPKVSTTYECEEHFYDIHTTERVFTNRDAHTWYRVTVNPVFLASEGSTGEATGQTLEKLIPNPSHLRTEYLAEQNGTRVSWEMRQTSSKYHTVEQYLIVYTDEDGYDTQLISNTTEVMLTNLDSGSNYTVTIVAITTTAHRSETLEGEFTSAGTRSPCKSSTCSCEYYKESQ